MVVDPIPLFQSQFPLFSLSSYLGGHHAPRSATVQASLSKSDCPARTSQFLKAETWWNTETLCNTKNSTWIKQTHGNTGILHTTQGDDHSKIMDNHLVLQHALATKMCLSSKELWVVHSSSPFFTRRVFPSALQSKILGTCAPPGGILMLKIWMPENSMTIMRSREGECCLLGMAVTPWSFCSLSSYCQQLSSQNMTLHISVEISTQQYIIYCTLKVTKSGKFFGNFNMVHGFFWWNLLIGF